MLDNLRFFLFRKAGKRFFSFQNQALWANLVLTLFPSTLVVTPYSATSPNTAQRTLLAWVQNWRCRESDGLEAAHRYGCLSSVHPLKFRTLNLILGVLVVAEIYFLFRHSLFFSFCPLQLWMLVSSPCFYPEISSWDTSMFSFPFVIWKRMVYPISCECPFFLWLETWIMEGGGEYLNQVCILVIFHSFVQLPHSHLFLSMQSVSYW